ncbi:MAG: DNA polymerase III subunit beta [Candidatus Omnitrophica bacterium]|nr:DNA polymerase III subunit beta [Candidatus Omnitrophota bacterium]MDD5430088.1 DNA polymerase III subunit beta [Candidatus Omnitrophota bacterium]
MKFIINKEILVTVLQIVLGPATTKQNIPSLSCVLIVGEGDYLKLTTTDLDLAISIKQKANIKEPGRVAIPIKRFLSIIRELPSGDVTVETIKSNLSIRCEKVEFKVNTINAEDFPVAPEPKETSLIKLEANVLEEMLKLTSFCVGYDDNSYVLGGVLFEVCESAISLAATDGKRLAYIQKNLPSDQPEVKTKISFILPIKAVAELHKITKEREGNLYMFTEDNRVGFDIEGVQFIARPLEGEFPNYKQYIPQETKERLFINRKKLLFALKRASILTTSDYLGVKMELKKEGVVIYKHTPQLGEVREAVEAKYEGSHLDIGFNPNYLTDALKNLEEEEVCMYFSGPDKPAVLRKKDYVYLILPMKM